MNNQTKLSNGSMESDLIYLDGQYSPLCFLFVPTFVLSLAGIPGTIVTIYFYGKQVPKSTTSSKVIFTALAVYDMVSLMGCFTFSAVAISQFYVSGSWTHGKSTFQYVVVVTRYFNECSNLMLLFTSVERVVSVASPHKKKGIFTKKLGIIYIIIIIIIIAPLNAAPIAMAEESLVLFKKKGSDVRYVQRIAMANVNQDLLSVLQNIAPIIYFGLPIGGVVICNIVLMILLKWRTLSRNNSDTQNTMVSPAREIRITKQVMAITTIFFLCVFPLIVIFPIRLANHTDIQLNTLLVIYPIASFLESVNYSMNAVVYYIGNPLFRKEVRHVMSMLRSRCKTSTVSPQVTTVTDTRI